MRKLIIITILCLVSVFAKGQVYQLMPQYGYDAKRMNFDSTLSIPSFCGVPSLLSNKTKKAAIAYDSCNNRFYYYNPKTLVWDYIKSVDTTSLSNRINLKLSISDTSGMLSVYLRKIDTTNKFVNSVVKVNDSTFRVFKGSTSTDITLSGNTGVATKLTTTVYNKSGALIPKGSVVYIDGAHSSLYPSIALAKANSEETSAYTFGVVENDISNMSLGVVVQVGVVTNLNLPTSSYTDGETLYLSPTVAGGYTTTKPLAPNHYVAIGTVIRAHPNFGTIVVAIRNGFQLDEMSDVQIPAVPNDSTLLQFSRVDSLWHSVSVTNAIGTKYIKPSDTATMLTPYARINLVNTKFTLPSLTSGSVLFSDGSTISQNNSNFFWDNTNNRLGIGTASPLFAIHSTGSIRGNALFAATSATIGGTSSANASSVLEMISTTKGFLSPRMSTAQMNAISSPATGLNIFNTDDSSNYVYRGTTSGWKSLAFGNIYSTDGSLPNPRSLTLNGQSLTFIGTTSTRFFANGNVGINQTTDAGYKLDVNGTARFSGAVTGGTNNGTFGDIILDYNTGTRRIKPAVNSLDITDASGNIGFHVDATGTTISSAMNQTSLVRGLGTLVYSSGTNQALTFGLNGAYQAHLIPFADIVANGYASTASSNKNTTLRIYTTNTTSGTYGNIILSHNGTSKTGNILVGTSTDVSTAIMNIESTTQGFLPPRMTTTQRDAISSPAAGLIIYNTTTNKHQGYNGTTWNDFY